MIKTVATATIVASVLGFSILSKRLYDRISRHLTADLDIMDNIRCVSYDYFIKNVKTGDILLAASKSASASYTRVWTGEPWTHVGLACRYTDSSRSIKVAEFGGHNPTEGVYNLSIDSDKRKVLGNGVGLYDLDMFPLFYGGLYWRPLSSATDEDRGRIRDSMRKFLTLRDLNESPNFSSIPEVISSLMFNEKSSSNSVLCSTVVALTLLDSGIVVLKKNIKDYLPHDFAEDPGWKMRIQPDMPKYVLGYKFDAVNF